jgi:DNA polymerase III epsilon subunit-like protein
VKAMSVTHITNKMVEDKESFMGSEMCAELQKLLGTGVLVAHNAKFDIGMLEAEGLKVDKHICTLRVARHLDPNNNIPEYNLQFLRYYLDLDIEGDAHQAESDVLVMCKVFERQFNKLKEELGSDEKVIEKMIEISKTPSTFSMFNFGKYKGMKVKEVLRTDRGYLEWLLKTKQQDDSGDEDWIHTLNVHLNA